MLFVHNKQHIVLWSTQLNFRNTLCNIAHAHFVHLLREHSLCTFTVHPTDTNLNQASLSATTDVTKHSFQIYFRYSACAMTQA